MKQSAVVAVLAFLAMAAAAVQVAAGLAPPAGYTKQEDVTTDFIQQVGKFSVNVYKIAYMIYMNYVSTSQCWSKPAGNGGDYYWMVLRATNRSGTAGTYVSTVWGIPGSESKTWKLLSFNSTN